MESKEDKLSSYIDSLNHERKPKEHGSTIESEEMLELFETVRKVRSLKEASYPKPNYHKAIAANINKRLHHRKKWFFGLTAVAASVAIMAAVSIPTIFNKTKIVYAMEQAYKEIKTYHGILEVVETNAEGKSVTQSKVEVWADREGHYYTKGLQGTQKDLVTVNDGQKKWQIQPEEKEVDVFAAFPDPYAFTLELGKEIENVKTAVNSKVTGKDTILGRAAIVLEVTPQGGSPYKLWIDDESKMPLQKQSSMEYALQYKVHYTTIDFTEAIPKDLLTYNIPEGFKEVNTNTDQIVNTLEEASKIAGFVPTAIEKLPAEYEQSSLSVANSTKSIKTNYVSRDKERKVSVLQKKATGKLKPASMAILGKIGDRIAEIQSPIQSEIGVLQGGGVYSGVTGLTSVRWQQDGIEYAVVGNSSLEEITVFIKGLSKGNSELLLENQHANEKATVEVPVDLKAEEGEQKNADAGHSSWQLDPVFVSQVFISLKLSPQGVQGNYPVKYEDLTLVKNTGNDAVIEIDSAVSTTVRRVYLKKLIRQDITGIWTVVGYDPAS